MRPTNGTSSPAAPILGLVRRTRREALALLYRITQRMAPAVLNRPIESAATAPLGADFLIGTLSGLLHYHRGSLYRLVDGRVYGITRHRDRWYAYRNQEPLFGKGWGPERGQVISFRLEGPRAVDVRAEIGLLDPEVHQIDAVGDQLLLTDTARNALRVYAITARGLRETACHYPNGQLRPDGSNYAHLNSVFFDGDHYYLVYHNKTYKTGRMSEIVQLDRAFRVQRRWATPAKSAHNVYVEQGAHLICNSQDGELLQDDKVLVKIPYYTRGLALNDELLLLGASEFANKAQRADKDGHVFALRRADLGERARLSIPGSGSVYELRFVDQPDHAMSAGFAAYRAGGRPLV